MRVIGWILILLVIASFTIGGCGSEPAGPSVAAESTASEKPVGSQYEEVVAEAKWTCEHFSPAKIASDYGWGTRDPSAVARRYAQTYKPVIAGRIEALCLKAFWSR